MLVFGDAGRRKVDHTIPALSYCRFCRNSLLVIAGLLQGCCICLVYV